MNMHTKRTLILGTILAISLGSATRWAMASEGNAFVLNVNPTTGAINVPENYTLWPTLGTWSHAKVHGGATNIHEYHVVYTQSKTIEYYQKKRRFPDEAVLVKELLHAETMFMTTGPTVGRWLGMVVLQRG